MKLGTLGIGVVIAFHIVGLLLFCKGYLLTRIVIPTRASCPVQQNAAQTCSGYPRQFRRILWVIIDALRYDFAVYDETLDPVPLYRNKLPYIRDLLRDEPNNARLYRFYADAPTTTLQRLKALSTGSLPTFIDFSLNFKGHEVSEDSLPHQMAANNKTVTFLGDDTWIGLYPRYFNTVVALPSFNVKDLHTVDNGVMQHLIPELKHSNTDWIIGHFLGVDHCGHTYGPSHPSMAEKLQQMNENLKSIFEQLDNDTIVFVFGDHGMTKGGDHGGESYLETSAALFVYSRRQLFCNKQEKDTISQIDLVPTTALLMGIPIPYSSLGAVMADVVQLCSSEDHETTMDYLTALTSNGQQILDYLQAYSKISGEFPADEYRDLQQLFNRTVMQQRALSHTFMLNGFLNSTTVKNIVEDYYQFMYSVKSMCISVWAKFDDYTINQGILILLLGCIVNMCMLWHVQYLHTMVITSLVYGGLCLIAAVTVMFVFTSVLYMKWDMLGVICSSLFTIFCFISLLILYSVKSQIFDMMKLLMKLSVGLLFEPLATLSNVASSIEDYIDIMISCAVLLCSSAALLSNSFIIYEGWVLTFFIQTLIVYKMLRDYLYSKSDGLGHHILIHIIVMLCVRSSGLFWTCREEIECQPTHFTFPFAIIHEELGLWSLVRLACYVGLVIAVPIWLLWWLRSNQVWNHFSYQLKCLLMTMVPTSLCICGFWVMQGFISVKQLDQMPHWQHVILPRIVYTLCILTIVKCVHESCWQVKPVDQKSNTALVARAYHVIMTTVTWMILVMLFQDGTALAVGMLLIQSFLLIYIYHSNNSTCVGYSWSLVVLWDLMIIQLYYATGHQPTITGMKLDAGFVGLHGEMVGYKLALAGFLVGLNSLVAQILLPWMVPLLVLWPCTKMNDRRSFTTAISEIQVTILKLLFCQTVKLLFSVLAASMHRRHLMVWGVFAPRFIAELFFVLVIDLVLVLTYLYTVLNLRRNHSTKLL